MNTEQKYFLLSSSETNSKKYLHITLLARLSRCLISRAGRSAELPPLTKGMCWQLQPKECFSRRIYQLCTTYTCRPPPHSFLRGGKQVGPPASPPGGQTSDVYLAINWCVSVLAGGLFASFIVVCASWAAMGRCVLSGSVVGGGGGRHCCLPFGRGWAELDGPRNHLLSDHLFMSSYIRLLESSPPHMIASLCPRILVSSRPHVLVSSRPHVLVSSSRDALASSSPCVLSSSSPPVLA